MLKTIKGFRQTTEAAKVTAAISHRANGAKHFGHQHTQKPTSQSPAAPTA